MGIAMAVATFISGPTVVAAAQLSRPHVRIGRLVMATEILAIAFASLVSGTGYHLAVFGSTGDPMVFAGVAALTAAVAVPMMRARGLYSAGLSDRFDLQLRSVLGAWLLALMFVAVLTFALKLGVAYRAGRFLLSRRSGPARSCSIGGCGEPPFNETREPHLCGILSRS